ncbi:MAG: DNA gyrase subunit A [Firmicutes bacterium ADurb.Bin300]|nr:MAG: DNA gyrase subunit A [Firmicutes bacterium ADurb.Bin300]
MAKKPKDINKKNEEPQIKANIAGAGEIVNQLITDTLEVNFMPYAMSVIMSRAIPEIDGLKPSHRKLLYTMYKMGLLSGPRTKSANIVGRTMQLNPHGDAAIYDTMVRLSRGNESLLHPFVDSKGNFGKAYSSNMQYAAARYTEAKLLPICNELFADIDKDTVDFADNYDGTMKEPTLLPVTFPIILTNANYGIAVGMASQIASFNLREICDATIELIKNPDFDVSQIVKAPDFVSGGYIVYNRETLDEIIESGRGSIRVRAKYVYDKSNNCIDITEIPPRVTSEQIIDRIVERVKAGVIKEISDVRDETDKGGLKITIDLKRGTDPDRLMKRLYKLTALEDTFSCNFNILIAGAPMVLGVTDILSEWIAFREECVRRRVYFDLGKAKERLHLLLGLKKILLDIDKAIKIIRNTDEEAEVVPNLMIGFGIDKTQAEFVAEIRLRHLNREYILKRTADIEALQKAVGDMEDILKSKTRIRKIIISELNSVKEKYGIDRKSEIIYPADEDDERPKEQISDYPVNLFFTQEGYFKKITPLSLRMGGEHKLKEGDRIIQTLEASNSCDLLFFTDKQQVYKSRACDFEDTKASVLGDFVGSKLEFDDDEKAIYMAVTTDYKGYMLFFFENGKSAKVDMDAYKTKTNRRKLINAYSDKSPLTAAAQISGDEQFVLLSSAGRILIMNSAAISSKMSKGVAGVNVMTLKKNQRLVSVRQYKEGEFVNPHRYRTKSLPAAGAVLSAADKGEQLTFE